MWSWAFYIRGCGTCGPILWLFKWLLWFLQPNNWSLLSYSAPQSSIIPKSIFIQLSITLFKALSYCYSTSHIFFRYKFRKNWWWFYYFSSFFAPKRSFIEISVRYLLRHCIRSFCKNQNLSCFKDNFQLPHRSFLLQFVHYHNLINTMRK